MKLVDGARILIFAGAGISQESGLATFRDNGGLWEQYDVMKICNFNQFLADSDSSSEGRQTMFDFYNMRKREILKAQPNLAHKTIAGWQQKFGVDRVKIVTSNIDDLFERAGCTGVVHVHGDIYHMKCANCDHTWEIGSAEFDSGAECEVCGSNLTKPNVVFFGEQAPEYATMNKVFSLTDRVQGDIVFYIGSSMNVIPASYIVRTDGWGKICRKAHHILVDVNAAALAKQSPVFQEVRQGTAVDVLPTFNF